MSAYYSPGQYQADITGQDLTTTEYGEQVIIKILPVCTGERKERTVYLSLTDQEGNPAKYVDKSLDVLFLLGFRGTDFGALSPESAAHQSFVGQQVVAYCQVKDDKEKWYINTPKADVKPVEKSAISRLNALFGKELKARSNGEKAPKADAPQAASRQPGTKLDGTQPVTQGVGSGAKLYPEDDSIPF